MDGMSHSRRLRQKIRLARQRLDTVAVALWTHPSLREIYPEFLFRNHAVIRASVPLMETAALFCQARMSPDPLAAARFRHFTHHRPAERHHDHGERVDLDALGVRRQKARARIP